MPEAQEEVVDPGRFGASFVRAHVAHVEGVSVAKMAELSVPVPALVLNRGHWASPEGNAMEIQPNVFGKNAEVRATVLF